MIKYFSVKEADDATNSKRKDPEYTPAALDNFINISIGLPIGTNNELYHSKVNQRYNNAEVRTVGVSISNMLN